MKFIKLLAALGKKAMKYLPKAAKVTAKTMWNNKKFAAAMIADHVVDTAIEKIRKAGNPKQALTDYIQSADTSALEAVEAEDPDIKAVLQAEMNPAVMTTIVKEVIKTEQPNPAKQIRNHPRDWFRTKSSIGGRTVTGYGLDAFKYLQDYQGYNLCLTKVNNDLYYSIMPSTLRQNLYATYLSTYRSLNLAPSKTEEQVSRDFMDILYGSWVAYSQLLYSKKMQNGKYYNYASNYQVGRSLLGACPLYRYNANRSRTVMQGFYLQKGESIATGEGDISPTNPEQARVQPSVVTTPNLTFPSTYEDPYWSQTYGHQSNADWAVLVDQVRALPITDSAVNIARYLFEKTWIETDPDSDFRIIFNIAPPVTNFTGETYTGQLLSESDIRQIRTWLNKGINDSISYGDTIPKICDDVRTKILSDRAYPTILALMGLSYFGCNNEDLKKVQGSNDCGTIATTKWKNDIADVCKRDLMRASFEWNEIREDEWRWIANTVYTTRDYTGEIIPIYPSSVGIDEDNTVSILAIRMRKSKGFINKCATITPNEELLDAGEVASALKFTSVFNIHIDSCMGWRNRNISNGVLWFNPVNPSFSISNSNEGNIIESLNLVNTNYATFTKLMGSLGDYTMIPGQQQLNLFMRNKLTDTGYRSYIGRGEYLPQTGFETITIKDAEAITDYQWANLFFGYDSLEVIQRRLNGIADYFNIR